MNTTSVAETVDKLTSIAIEHQVALEQTLSITSDLATSTREIFSLLEAQERRWEALLSVLKYGFMALTALLVVLSMILLWPRLKTGWNRHVTPGQSKFSDKEKAVAILAIIGSVAIIIFQNAFEYSPLLGAPVGIVLILFVAFLHVRKA
jgi:cobalamin synthase